MTWPSSTCAPSPLHPPPSTPLHCPRLPMETLWKWREAKKLLAPQTTFSSHCLPCTAYQPTGSAGKQSVDECRSEYKHTGWGDYIYAGHLLNLHVLGVCNKLTPACWYSRSHFTKYRSLIFICIFFVIIQLLVICAYSWKPHETWSWKFVATKHFIFYQTLSRLLFWTTWFFPVG